MPTLSVRQAAARVAKAEKRLGSANRKLARATEARAKAFSRYEQTKLAHESASDNLEDASRWLSIQQRALEEARQLKASKTKKRPTRRRTG